MFLFILTAITLLAFAANSLLCRMALGGDLIDPVSFTAIRLISGALVLLPISRIFTEPTLEKGSGSWGSGLALFGYAAAFSLAYISLSTGIGALILFGAVQITMISAALIAGERLGVPQWMGSIIALAGLVYLVLPGISSPNPIGAVLMCVSGISWGVYSIRGKGVSTPVSMTGGNFIRAALMGLILCGIAFSWFHLEPEGIVLALVSGGLTSGLGYVLWYKALRDLTTTQASVVQLLVPALAAFGGVVLLSEQVGFRLISASVLILGGVALAVMRRQRSPV